MVLMMPTWRHCSIADYSIVRKGWDAYYTLHTGDVPKQRLQMQPPSHTPRSEFREYGEADRLREMFQRRCYRSPRGYVVGRFHTSVTVPASWAGYHRCTQGGHRVMYGIPLTRWNARLVNINILSISSPNHNSPSSNLSPVTVKSNRSF